MTRGEKAANLAGVVVPFAGVLVAIVLLWQQWVDVTDLILLAVFYVLSGIGVTVGIAGSAIWLLRRPRTEAAVGGTTATPSTDAPDGALSRDPIHN